jgi:hypothetical protein
VTGTYNSYNPNNLDPYDYYNWSGSPGYAANAQGINFYNQLIGRPSTAVMAAHVNGANQADYLSSTTSTGARMPTRRMASPSSSKSRST